jgi:predicted outer membrane protein
MATMTRRAALMLATGGLLAGCDTTRSRSSSDLSASDLEFVTNAFNIIEFDLQECTLAQTQAQSPEVRALAAQLLQDALNFKARVVPVAASAGISPPTALRTDLRVRVAHLRLNQGLDFDRIFIEDQIFSHQEARNMHEMVANTPGNPQIAVLSREATSIVRANLEKLRALQRKMMLQSS